MISISEWRSYSDEEKWQYVQTLEKLLESRDEIVKLFDCPDHGQCVPYAIQEIKRLQNLDKADG